MIEIRWVQYETGKTLMNEWGYYYPETDKKLQYRFRTTATDYSSDVHEKIVIWSEWQDVKTVSLSNS